MNLSERFDVSPGKVAALLERIRRLGIDSTLIQERFVRGSGPGGQKTNKTSNGVVLRYSPLAITVRCREDRRRSVNRFLALRELIDRIEMILSPETSRRLTEIERRRASKAKAHRRSAAKHRREREG